MDILNPPPKYKWSTASKHASMVIYLRTDKVHRSYKPRSMTRGGVDKTENWLIESYMFLFGQIGPPRG